MSGCCGEACAEAATWPRAVTRRRQSVRRRNSGSRNLVRAWSSALSSRGSRRRGSRSRSPRSVLLQDTEETLRDAASIARSWRADRDGRLRHRLFVARATCAAFPFDKIKIDLSPSSSDIEHGRKPCHRPRRRWPRDEPRHPTTAEGVETHEQLQDRGGGLQRDPGLSLQRPSSATAIVKILEAGYPGAPAVGARPHARSLVRSKRIFVHSFWTR